MKYKGYIITRRWAVGATGLYRNEWQVMSLESYHWCGDGKIISGDKQFKLQKQAKQWIDEIIRAEKLITIASQEHSINLDV